jgi:hypothetical protein
MPCQYSACFDPRFPPRRLTSIWSWCLRPCCPRDDGPSPTCYVPFGCRHRGMCRPIIECYPSANGRPGHWLAPGSRSCWTMWSRRGRCSGLAMIRSPSTLDSRPLARVVMACGRPTAMPPIAGAYVGRRVGAREADNCDTVLGAPRLGGVVLAPEWDRVQGTRHKTPAHMARLQLARLMCWFPERHLIFVGDTGYGPVRRRDLAVNTLVISPWSVGIMAMPPSMSPRHCRYVVSLARLDGGLQP